MGKLPNQNRCFHNLLFCLKQSAVLCFLLCSIGYSKTDPSTVSQTKHQLKLLDAKIEQLKKNLIKAQASHQVKNKKLTLTEQQLHQSISKLKTMSQIIAKKQQSINSMSAKYQQLNQQLVEQQLMLAEHVRAFYKMGNYQPIKWMLNQDDPAMVNRLLTYYQYLTRARLSLITTVRSTKRQIQANQVNLNTELADARKLQATLHKHQEELNSTKQYHTLALNNLDQTIKQNTHTLNTFKQDKANLKKLLDTLLTKDDVHTKIPFSANQHQLKLPVPVKRQAITTTNHGLLFPAAEGTLIHAVYPGKIVFSDWLNGYGLLLIIDHGQGFMTLYAYNQSLYKTKGALVQQGETIAGVGYNIGSNRSGLYFEIRRHGKPVAPLTWFF